MAGAKDTYKYKVIFSMQDGSRIYGYVDVFKMSRITDMLNAKYDQEQFVAVYNARLVLPTKKLLRMPMVLINRYSIDDYEEVPGVRAKKISLS